jgi:phosphoserine phosphatase RsbU/P
VSQSLGKLLVVDDNEMNRDMLARRLTRRGYEVITAPDGQNALDLIAEQSFDLVMLDIMMPGLSGWEVLERIRASRSRLELPVIMATAKDGSDDIVRALTHGASDYVTKPLDIEVVLARVGTHVILKMTHEKLRAANKKLKKDLAAAAHIQRSQLPLQTPLLTGCEVAWYFRPCDELGGDFLNVFDIGTDYVGMYLLDVSGHGVPAALMSVAVSQALSPSSTDTCIVSAPDRSKDDGPLRVTPPGQVADKINRRFQIVPDAQQFFTLVYGLYEHKTHRFRFTSAGHPPVIHLPRRGRPRVIDFSGGPPIGLFQQEEGVFGPYEEQELTLGVGDRLVLYSDGVTEAMDAHGQMFGISRLLEHVETTANSKLQDAVDDLRDTLLKWCGESHSPADDISILIIQIAE